MHTHCSRIPYWHTQHSKLFNKICSYHVPLPRCTNTTIFKSILSSWVLKQSRPRTCPRCKTLAKNGLVLVNILDAASNVARRQVIDTSSLRANNKPPGGIQIRSKLLPQEINCCQYQPNALSSLQRLIFRDQRKLHGTKERTLGNLLPNSSKFTWYQMVKCYIISY